MTQLQNSAFKVDSGSVPDVSKILPEPGAFIISEHDGNMYYADEFGWHQAEQPYSGITFFVDFNGTAQFNFKFKAPIGSTLLINPGDGTVIEAGGADNTLVTVPTAYTEAGLYYFAVTGDTVDVTELDVDFNPNVTGSVAGFQLMPNLDTIKFFYSGLYGNIEGFSKTKLVTTNLHRSFGLVLDVAFWKPLASTLEAITVFSFAGEPHNLGITGDITEWKDFTALDYPGLSCCAITWGGVVELSWPLESGYVNFYNNDWSFKMVDDCLISLANNGVINSDINLSLASAGTYRENASRTAKSNDAMATLIANGNTVQVREDNVP